MPYLLPIIGSSVEDVLVLKTSHGIVVDTSYSTESVPENFTTLEASYLKQSIILQQFTQQFQNHFIK